jgi:hypothetical protein
VGNPQGEIKMKKASKKDFLEGKYEISIRCSKELLCVVENVPKNIRYVERIKHNILAYVYPTHISILSKELVFFNPVVHKDYPIEQTFFGKDISQPEAIV